jgi:beta-N-acetylhexosaminidase
MRKSRLVGGLLTVSILASPAAVHESGLIGPTDSTFARTIDSIGEAEIAAGEVMFMVGKNILQAAGVIDPSPGFSEPAQQIVAEPAVIEEQAPPASGESCIADMPLGQRLGQLVMIGVDGNNMMPSAGIFKDHDLGGAIIMGKPTNLQNGRVNIFKQSTDIPLLIATDEEGGQVQRFRSLGTLPAPADIAANMSPQAAQDLIAKHSRKLADVGVDMVFGPLLDVAPASGESPMEDRLFGNDPQTVAEYGRAYIAGWRENGIIPTVKHFPGLGSATGNTDFQTATTPPIDALRERDLLPYDNLGDTGGAVMTGNQLVPGLSPDTPASLSKAVVTDELRGRLGFDGLIITDSLNAEAIKERLSDAVKHALQAGNDIALVVDVPKDQDWNSALTAISDKLQQAVANGELPEEQVNASVGRVLMAKHVDPCSIN